MNQSNLIKIGIVIVVAIVIAISAGLQMHRPCAGDATDRQWALDPATFGLITG